jgi:hypothetical protein
VVLRQDAGEKARNKYQANLAIAKVEWENSKNLRRKSCHIKGD